MFIHLNKCNSFDLLFVIGISNTFILYFLIITSHIAGITPLNTSTPNILPVVAIKHVITITITDICLIIFGLDDPRRAQVRFITNQRTGYHSDSNKFLTTPPVIPSSTQLLTLIFASVLPVISFSLK